MRRRHAPARWAAVLLLPVLTLGAGPPEAVRIRVPSASVGAVFPAGTELRGMTADEFEALMAAARSGYRRRQGEPAGRLLRARHFMRWTGELLEGRSELVAEAADGGVPELKVFPWTPAIEPGGAGPAALRMYADGATAVRLAPSATSTVVLKWELRARAGSQGRRFALGLPECETTRLVLDVPAGWQPEGPEGMPQGPGPGGDGGRKTWRFDGRGGMIDLVFHPRRDGGDRAQDPPAAWVSESSRVEIADASASWTTEWTVSLDPRGPRRLVAELDEGLELVEVVGPALEQTRAEPAGGRTRVTMSFGVQAKGPTRVTLKAIARVPAEGRWTVPAARPLDASWTGGRTSVRLDSTRVLKDCREGAGRRVPARAGDPADPGLLVFEANSPRSVAVLDFGRPRTDVVAEVRGQLLLGNSSPRLESQLTWRVTRGRLLGLDVDLPAAWVPDRIQVAGVDEPTAWHTTTVPGGGVRVHVTPPSGDFARSSLVLNLAATADIAGGRGPIMLPRVRPVGVPVVDERWLAWTESGLTLQPSSATGLAWIDPSLVIGPTTERLDTPGLREALAWRWISDEAEARVERDRVPSEPGGTIRLLAGADRDRLQLDWRITVDAAGEPIRSLPIAASDPLGASRRWRFTDEASGRDLELRPIAPGARSKLGLPESGGAWELSVPDSGAGPIVVRSRVEVPWDGQGRLPLLFLPSHFRSRNRVIVEVARNLQASLQASGMQRLEGGVAAEAMGIGARADLTGDPPARRRAGAFGYTRPGGRLELRTEALGPLRTDGVIEQAVLATFIDPRGPCRHRLTLRVALSDARSLDMVFPPGSRLVRVRRDGQAVAPSRNGEATSLPLGSPSSSRSASTFVLEYLTPRRALADSGAYRPERPSASLPYLAFRWEVAAPDPWAVADHGPALVAGDPAPAASWLRGPASSVSRAWRRPRAPATSLVDDPTRSLDRRVAETLGGEMTLGECLTRWDAGRWPLVIDRMALESAGWGPRSRVTPPRVSPSPAGAARAVLQPMGLSAVALTDAVLITTRADAPDRAGGPFGDPGMREAWEDRIRETLVKGSDVADRFQTVARWRGEITPRAVYAGEPGEIEPVSEGWRVWRFAASGWPEAGVTIRLVDRRREAARGWAAGLSLLALGIACRGLAPRVRAIGLAAALVACIAAVAATRAGGSTIAAGALQGALAVLFYWAGPALPRRLRTRTRGRDPRNSATPRVRTGGPGVVAGLLAGLALAASAEPVRFATAGAEETEPILAVFPFDGPADPARKPDRAVMRLADYERLKGLAGEPEQGSGGSPAALSATHVVSWQAAGSAAIETELELEAAGRGRATWTFPVGDARDISATLDGADVPVFVQAGGGFASVPVAGAGRQRLRIRRTVRTRRAERADSLTLPINPLAAARIKVSAGPAGRRAEVASARGAVEAQSGGAEGQLGPAELLDVRWVSDATAATAAPAGLVEGMLLWDAEPAGDRLRARWTFRNPAGTSLVRLRLEPGLVVRSATIPGAWDQGYQAADSGLEWVARVDPPMPDGTAIRMEFWRPRPPDVPGGDLADRTLPRVDLVGVESYSGAIGFRRPSDWSGRLAPAPAGDPVTEEAFVRGWGNLPGEPLTLSGVTRFARSPGVSVRTGPVPSRFTVEPSVELDLGRGRIDLGLEAKVTQVSGRSYGAELLIPEGLRVVRVDGEGMTDWSRSGQRLLLRFDAATARARTVRLVGWLPVPENPLSTGDAQQEVAAPWPGWIDAETIGATLTISSSGSFDLATSGGVVPLPTPSRGEANGKPGRRTISYRVDRPEGLGRLRWAIDPPRVDVLVRSQVTIHPDSAEWIAVARHDVSGGPCDSIRLEIPTAWAEAAEIKLVGGHRQLVSEPRGATTLVTIRPARPIWGSERLTVRSVRSLPAARTLVFPDLKPIVNGAREAYLALVNASGRVISPGGEGGLQAIDDASRFQSEEFSPIPGLPAWFFRARPEGWSLKVEAPGELPLASALSTGQARADLAEIEFVASEDGSGLGSLQCQFREGSGPFFSVSLPGGATPLWASVDGTPARPLRASSGRWLIPMGEGAAGHVRLIWKWSTSGPFRRVPLPSLDDHLPTFVSLWGADSLEVAAGGRVLEPVAVSWQEIARAQRLVRSLLQQIATIDRSSLRARETLVSAMVDLELVLRGAERAASRETSGTSSARNDSLELARQRVRAARAEVSDALETVGLDELEEAARIHLGLAREDPSAPAPAIVDPSSHLRLRRLGPGRRFLGQVAATAKPGASAWAASPAAPVPRDEQGWTLALAALILPALGWGLVRRSGRPGFLGGFYLVLLLGVVAIIGGPWCLLAAMTLTALGGRPAA